MGGSLKTFSRVPGVMVPSLPSPSSCSIERREIVFGNRGRCNHAWEKSASAVFLRAVFLAVEVFRGTYGNALGEVPDTDHHGHTQQGAICQAGGGVTWGVGVMGAGVSGGVPLYTYSCPGMVYIFARSRYI